MLENIETINAGLQMMSIVVVGLIVLTVVRSKRV